jgi:hypothetical protein
VPHAGRDDATGGQASSTSRSVPDGIPRAQHAGAVIPRRHSSPEFRAEPPQPVSGCGMLDADPARACVPPAGDGIGSAEHGRRGTPSGLEPLTRSHPVICRYTGGMLRPLDGHREHYHRSGSASACTASSRYSPASGSSPPHVPRHQPNPGAPPSGPSATIAPHRRWQLRRTTLPQPMSGACSQPSRCHAMDVASSSARTSALARSCRQN